MKRKTTLKTPQFINKIYIGIDNGVTGTMGWSGFTEQGTPLYGQTKIPVFVEQNYQKAKENISRVDTNELKKQLLWIKEQNRNVFVFIERPMVNPQRFKASGTALRALEATLVVLEEMEIGRQFVDSKEWQKSILPAYKKGADLKKLGIDTARRIFPSINFVPDADGILIAEWARRNLL